MLHLRIMISCEIIRICIIYHRACKTVSITHPHYWENVADMVRTKTADSCKDFYYQNEKPAKSVERKKKVSTKGLLASLINFQL